MKNFNSIIFQAAICTLLFLFSACEHNNSIMTSNSVQSTTWQQINPVPTSNNLNKFFWVDDNNGYARVPHRLRWD